MRQHVTTGAELAGFASITAGVAIGLGLAAALITGGVLLVLTGYLIGRRS